MSIGPCGRFLLLALVMVFALAACGDDAGNDDDDDDDKKSASVSSEPTGTQFETLMTQLGEEYLYLFRAE